MDQASAAAYAAHFLPPDAHPTPAVNPPPPLPSHPSYAEMITAAIVWDNSQGKAGGSSKRAIAKYIDRVYTNLPPTHSALLTHHLKRLKNSGHLVMLKNSYQIPSLATAAVPSVPAPPTSVPAPDSTPKRKPGRPPKAQAQPQAQFQAQPQAQQVAGNGPASAGKRPRGRPPKEKQQTAVVPTAEVPFVHPVAQPHPVYANVNVVPDNNGVTVTSPKRRPGRPPKNKPQPEIVQPVYQAQFQAQVQAPQQQGVAVGQANGVVKRKPGRPAKAKVGPTTNAPANGIPATAVNNAPAIAAVPVSIGVTPPGVGRGRGRPRRNALAPVARPVGKRPRGRPPRQVGVAVPAAAVAAMVAAGGGGGVKRRGRPKGSGGAKVVKQQRKVGGGTGKPRGRPRRNASVAGNTSEQGQSMANEELLRKLENMQLEIRDAVGVIRPYVANQNAADALTALQKLEGLSAMDLSASQTIASPVMTLPATTTAPPPSTSVPESFVAAAPPSFTAAPNLTAPPMMTVDAPPGMGPFSGSPLPFGVTVPTMAVTAPLHAPPGINSQQPMNWFPSSGAQS